MGMNRFTWRMEEDRIANAPVTTRMTGPPHLARQGETLLRHLTDFGELEMIGDGMILSRDGLKLVKFWRSGTTDTDHPS